jgi:hypothetical protein
MGEGNSFSHTPFQRRLSIGQRPHVARSQAGLHVLPGEASEPLFLWMD